MRAVGVSKSLTSSGATIEIRTLARYLLEHPRYQQSLRRRLLAGKAPQVEVLLFHYAYGRPVERTPQNGAFTFDLGAMLERVVQRAEIRDPRDRALPQAADATR